MHCALHKLLHCLTVLMMLFGDGGGSEGVMGVRGGGINLKHEK